jgi:succinate dehydrogenase hydrophobic anchor subunit
MPGWPCASFPANFRQYKVFAEHKNSCATATPALWWLQLWTGFALFFMGTVHLYDMLTQPALIGPYESADRVWTGNMWPLYLMLLFAAELHASVGLYRLAIKWGWFAAASRTASRRRLRWAKHGISAFLHHPRPGQPERPTSSSAAPTPNMPVSAMSRPAAVKLGELEFAAVPPESTDMEVIHTDVLVIGGGLAGLRAARRRAGSRGHESHHPQPGAAQALALGRRPGRHAGQPGQHRQGRRRQ